MQRCRNCRTEEFAFFLACLYHQWAFMGPGRHNRCINCASARLVEPTGIHAELGAGICACGNGPPFYPDDDICGRIFNFGCKLCCFKSSGCSRVSPPFGTQPRDNWLQSPPPGFWQTHVRKLWFTSVCHLWVTCQSCFNLQCISLWCCKLVAAPEVKDATESPVKGPNDIRLKCLLVFSHVAAAASRQRCCFNLQSCNDLPEQNSDMSS